MTTADLCVWTFAGMVLAFVGMVRKIYSLHQEVALWKSSELDLAERLRKLQQMFDQRGNDLDLVKRVLQKRDLKLSFIRTKAGILDKAIVEFFTDVAGE